MGCFRDVRLLFDLNDDAACVVALAEVLFELIGLGMSVQFVEIDPQDAARIRKYVARSGALLDPSDGKMAA